MDCTRCSNSKIILSTESNDLYVCCKVDSKIIGTIDESKNIDCKFMRNTVVSK